jgi:hypothetical protein
MSPLRFASIDMTRRRLGVGNEKQAAKPPAFHFFFGKFANSQKRL